ncbi:MAG: SDR family NAD(P)-dependent oxidoreductase [bacterium]
MFDAFESESIAMVIGATGGVGAAMVTQLVASGRFDVVVCASRRPTGPAPGCEWVFLDVEDETSIQRASQHVTERYGRLDLLINTVGFLHDEAQSPEKRLEDLDPVALQRSFAINAIGPALVYKHFHRLFRHKRHGVMATLSARVGSISDNGLGGWYGYRASKAAQNQITRTAAIEMARKAPKCVVVALHPGTVATRLSEPFQKGVPADKLFSAQQSAGYLLSVIGELTPDHTGGFYAWDGQVIPW